MALLQLISPNQVNVCVCQPFQAITKSLSKLSVNENDI